MFVARYLKLIASVIVAAVLMMAVVVPMVYNQSMETITIENDGAGWARFSLNPSGDYSESFTTDGSNITIGAQTGTASDMIVYATDVFSIVHADNSFYLIAPGDNSADLGASAGVASASGVITVTDSSDNAAYSTDAATWAYVPDAAGDFGFFTDSGATINDYPVAAAGSFAGVHAYNAINSLNLASISPTYSTTGGVFTTGPWIVSDSLITVNNTLLGPNEIVSLGAAVDPSTGTLIDGLYYTFSGTKATVVGISSALSSATSITIPNTVTYDNTTYNVKTIAASVFAGLTDLETIVFPSNVNSINSYALQNCTSLTSVELPSGLINLGGNVFDGCTSLTSVEIPNLITSLSSETFKGCTSLTSVELPSGLTTIGSGVFQNCTSLTSVELPSGITGILSNTFNGCTSLTSVELPSGVTKIRDNAFNGCTSLTSVELPSGLTTIDSEAFYRCTSLTSVELPSGLTTIGNAAFRNCTNLEYVVIWGSPTIGTNCFTNSGITEILNFGNTDIAPGSYGLDAAAVVSDGVLAMGYMAPVDIYEQTPRAGVLYDVLALLPVMILVGVMMGVVALFLANRRA